MWFFRPDHRKLQRLFLTGLMGKSCFLRLDLVHSQGVVVSEDNCSQGLRHLWLIILTYLHFQSRSLHSSVSYLRPWPEIFFRCLFCVLLIEEGRREYLKPLLPTLTQHPVILPYLAVPPSPSPPLWFINCQRLLFRALGHVSADLLDL